MKTLSALIVNRNEESLLKGCLDRLHDFVDEIVFVDMESTDNSAEIAKSYPKVKYFTFPYTEPVPMDKARSFSFEKATGDWCLIVDADEYYPKESMDKIREFIETTDAISARVNYTQLSWRSGYKQANFEHYPDRLYRRDVFDHYEGVLPNDMLCVKKEFQLCPNKYKGINGSLEYDNDKDESFEHPHQPIRKDISYYHLARTRGHHFEFSKRVKYEMFLHPLISKQEAIDAAQSNGWVQGLYETEKIDVPEGIPTQTIQNPKVSIIIPHYNYAQYIEKCVESCLNQTIKPHEIILVNDGSPDNIDEIVKQWLDVPGFIYWKQTNFGESIARNTGGNIATGDYFVFLDADDYIREDFIEKTLATIGDNEVCIPDMTVFNEANYDLRFSDFTSEELHRQQIMPSTCCLYKAEAWLNHKFDPSMLYCDWELYLRLDGAGYRFINCHEFLFFYNRKLDSNISKLDARKEEGLAQLAKYSITPI